MKIRMINKAASGVFRDCSNGSIYEIEFRAKGGVDTLGVRCWEDTYCLKDDVGDNVCAWIGDIEAAAVIL